MRKLGFLVAVLLVVPPMPVSANHVAQQGWDPFVWQNQEETNNCPGVVEARLYSDPVSLATASHPTRRNAVEFSGKKLSKFNSCGGSTSVPWGETLPIEFTFIGDGLLNQGNSGGQFATCPILIENGDEARVIVQWKRWGDVSNMNNLPSMATTTLCSSQGGVSRGAVVRLNKNYHGATYNGTTYKWRFKKSTPVPSTRWDARSVLVHELYHTWGAGHFSESDNNACPGSVNFLDSSNWSSSRSTMCVGTGMPNDGYPPGVHTYRNLNVHDRTAGHFMMYKWPGVLL